jgi:hypothetical protein
MKRELSINYVHIPRRMLKSRGALTSLVSNNIKSWVAWVRERTMLVGEVCANFLRKVSRGQRDIPTAVFSAF